MKKIAVLFAALSVLLSSCGKIDSSKWLDNLEDGKKAAVKENKEILVFFSTNEDGYSKELREGLFASEEFLTEQTAKFVLVNLDYSAERFQSAMAAEGSSKAEQKAAEKVKALIDRDMKWTIRFNLEMTPSFFVVSKEGFVLTKLDYTDENMTLESFNEMIAAKAEKIQKGEEILAKVRESKGIDKVKAIEELFNETDPGHRDLMAPLFAEAIKIDEKNESGVIGTFLLSLANSKATDLYLNEKMEEVYVPFEEVSENALLSASEKQQALYMAGYLLASTGSMDYDKVKEFFQRAIDANPDDEHSAYLQNWIAQIDERQAEMAEAANSASGDTEAPAAESSDAGDKKDSASSNNGFEVIQ